MKRSNSEYDEEKIKCRPRKKVANYEKSLYEQAHFYYLVYSGYITYLLLSGSHPMC